MYYYCEDGLQEDGTYECPGATQAIQGTLVCEELTLWGVCHNYTEECDPGYQRVSPYGCEPLFDCGNGVKEAGEDCDGTDLGGATCDSLGIYWDGDTLACYPDCGFDVTGCI